MSGKDVKELQMIADLLRSKMQLLNTPKQLQEKELPQISENHVDINSDSEMEALQLFGNVAPAYKKNETKQKGKEQRLEKKDASTVRKQTEVMNQPQNNIKSILKQQMRMQQEPSSPPHNHAQKESSEHQQADQQSEQRKGKSVSFNFEDNLIFSLNPDRKWNDPITDQKKGKFQLYEQKALSDAIGQYLVTNQIKFDEFVKWLSIGSKEQRHILRRQKFFKLLSSVLPNRTPMSCYKFVCRNYNSLNHQGEWTPEEVEKLRSLVQKYGRQWTRIGRELGRTSDNVYDKYRSIGEEGLQERAKGLWKLRELVQLVMQIQKQTGIEFIDHNIKKELQTDTLHDNLEQKELKQHRYNSKLFTFHNIEVLRKYIDARMFQGIQLETLKWKKIVRKIASRSHFDCRNKVVQILQVLFRNNESLDEGLINFLERERATEESKLDWKRWRSETYTAQEAKNRFMIVKKLVEGRTVKPFKQVYQEVIAKLKKMLEKPKQK